MLEESGRESGEELSSRSPQQQPAIPVSPAEEAGDVVMERGLDDTSLTSTTSSSPSSCISGLSGESDMVCSDFCINSSVSSDGQDLMSRMKDQTVIDISETITAEGSMGSKVTLYKINLQSNNICFHLPSSCVWRSYSEFVWLRRRLVSSASLLRRHVPEIPSRSILDLFNKNIAEERKDRLQDFIEKVVVDRSFLSDAAVHLFLQSNLTADEIQAWLDGKVAEPVVELIQRGKELVTPTTCVR